MDAVTMESSKADSPGDSQYLDIKANEEETAHEEETANEEDTDVTDEEETDDEKPDPDRFFYMALDYDHDQEDRIKEEFRQYHRDVIKYEGFLIKNRPSVRFFGEIVELILDDEKDSKEARRFTEFAIDMHNKQNNTDLKLVEIKRGNVTLKGDMIFYLTFDAEDSSYPDQKKATYQAEVRVMWRGPSLVTLLKKFRKGKPVDQSS